MSVPSWEELLEKLRESCRICEEIIAHDARPACCAKDPETGYLCSLALGHAGLHVAQGDYEQLATWTPHHSERVNYAKPGDPDYVRRESIQRVLALWRELNILAETDIDAAAIVNAYRHSREAWRLDLPPVDRQLHGSCDCPAAANEDCPFSEAECAERSFHHASLTVRSWFRQMRAADFERDVRQWTARSLTMKPDCAGPWDDGRELQRFHRVGASVPWTLFDTQAVVERETKATHLSPAETLGSRFFTAFWGRFLADPKYIRRLRALPEEKRKQLREGDWDIGDCRDDTIYLVPHFLTCPACGEKVFPIEHLSPGTLRVAQRCSQGHALEHPERYFGVIKGVGQ
jgi:hypothetical protein